MVRRGVLVLALLVGCEKAEDDCQRAIRRLGRISEAKGAPPRSGKAIERLVESCRTDAHAGYDPVLRCAMDSPTDDAAAECVDRGIKDVLHVSDGSAGGAGLNPLLHD